MNNSFTASNAAALRSTRAPRLLGAIDARPATTVAALLALYLLIACAQAATKLLWTDELITLAIARRGSLAAIWHALALGADPNPPLSHWMATRLFGDSALALRLPSILCVLLAIVSLWTILRRWLAPSFAGLGVLAFMATRGFDYAYDARSYAPLLGFSMAALALWLASTNHAGPGRIGLPRIAALAGMAAALALALSSNYYGVLAFAPITIGEAVLVARTRRQRPGTWIALTLAALPLLAFRPLIRHNLAEFGPHAWNRPRLGMLSESYLVLVEGVFWPVLAFALAALWQRRRHTAHASGSETLAFAPEEAASGIETLASDHETLASAPGTLPSAQPPGSAARAHVSSVAPTLQPHEQAALAVLLLYPFLGLLLAVVGHGLISPRCVLPVCCGFAIAAALLARRIFPGPRAAIALLAVALLWVAARESACGFVLAQQRSAFFALRDQVAAEPHSRPIVVADSLFVLPLAYYSSDAVRDRILVPIDFEAIHRYETDDSGEQNLWAGRDGLYPVRSGLDPGRDGLYPISIVPYGPALLAHPALTVIARPSGWLAHSLARDGYRVTETPPSPAWNGLGGVFTPLAHDDTRILTAAR